MALAVVRSLGMARRLRSATEPEDFEQELVDQYALAAVSDRHVAQDRSRPEDMDRYLAWLRKTRGQAKTTVRHKAWALAQFFDFLVLRYQGDIYVLTGYVVDQPVDEYKRPVKADYDQHAHPDAAPD